MKFMTKSKMEYHVKTTHNSTAVTCPKGCNPEKLYKTGASLRGHVKTYPSGFVETPCPQGGCSSKRVFKDREALRRHLGTHLLSIGKTNEVIESTQKGGDRLDSSATASGGQDVEDET
jgi:hypothetical protein